MPLWLLPPPPFLYEYVRAQGIVCVHVVFICMDHVLFLSFTRQGGGYKVVWCKCYSTWRLVGCDLIKVFKLNAN